ncbi:MAG: hypothetical protein AAGI46_15165 [Planctomycetota bacterium]
MFLVPLGLALAYLFAYSLSGWTFGDADVDADLDVDADVVLDLDADVDFDADVGVDAAVVKPDIDVDTDIGDTPSGILNSLTWVGVGKVPLSIVLMVLLLSFGVVGFATNQLLRDAMGVLAVAVSLPLAVVLALVVTATTSQLIARYMPLSESSAERRSSYVGRRGTVVFTVSPKTGTISVRDAGGDLYQLPARTRDGTIAPGTDVVLTDYQAGVFRVKQLDL